MITLARFVRLVVATALAVPTCGPAFADARLAVPCANGVPCSMFVTGHVDAVGSARLPWTASVIVPADVCLYIQEFSSDAGARINAVTPDGKLAAKNPIGEVYVSPTVAGWYTIEVDSQIPAGEQIFRIKISFNATRDCSSSLQN